MDRLDRVSCKYRRWYVWGWSMTHQRVVADRQFCVIRLVHRAWLSVTLCVLTLETVTGRWWMSRKTIEDRQTGSRRTLRKTRGGMQTGGLTDGRSVDRRAANHKHS